MKKIFLFIISFLIFIPCCYASSVNKINMDIYIDENGDALVKEVWDTKSTSGTTEIYKTYNNVGDSTFTDFKVSLGSKTFTNIGVWDIDASFSEKAYKNGIHYISDGVELCWGASTYGNNVYTIEYKITNFVINLTDSQMVYWRLIPNNISGGVDYVYIKVHSYFNFSDSLGVWGYGIYGAPTYVYNGYIEMVAEDGISSSDYMTMLIKFDSNSFKTDYSIDHDFNYYLDMAEEGSTDYVDDNSVSFFDVILTLISILFSFVIPFFVIIFAINSTKKNYYKSNKKITEDVPYFRDIPCDGEVFRSFYISNLYGLCKKKEDFFGVILLKWLKLGYISIEKIEEKKSLFSDKKTVSALKIGNVVCDNALEKEIYDIIVSASKDGVLSEGEFEKYCKNHYSSVLGWFDKVLNYEMDSFITSGELVKNVEKKFLIKKTTYEENDSIYNDAVKLKGLKKYLEYFSNMNDKEVIEVHLWKDYLIYAQMFGIAKKVASQFKNMYPEVLSDYSNSGFSDFDTFVFINSLSNAGIKSATTAQSRANSYSSGGGGYSSGGGGGGGSGGGGFR